MNDEDARAFAVHILAVFAVSAPFAVQAAASDAAPAGANRPRPAAGDHRHVAEARRRHQDIPISVSAISGAQLAEHHVATTTTSPARCPASRSPPAGPGLDNIEIRGVSSMSGSATVGIYIDEVSVTISNSQFDGAVQRSCSIWIASRCCAVPRAPSTARARWRHHPLHHQAAGSRFLQRRGEYDVSVTHHGESTTTSTRS